MASLHVPSPGFLAAFLPVARAQLLPQSGSAVHRIPLLQRLRLSPLLPAALSPIPSLIGDIWDGLLNAVPKKKTSHMKKRHRQLASGKHLKDVTALNKCSACGRLKRAHVLCPYCVHSIKRWFGNGFKSPTQVEADEERMFEIYQKERRLMGMKPLDKPDRLMAAEERRHEKEESEGQFTEDETATTVSSKQTVASAKEKA